MPLRNTVLHILLADDDAIDRELFIEGVAKTGVTFTIREASNGIEVMDMLSGGNYPHMIFLDLNMPLKDGRETLKEIKQSSQLRHIPVFILSTSNAIPDVSLAYSLGANLFIVKPDNFSVLVQLLQTLLGIINKYLFLPVATGQV